MNFYPRFPGDYLAKTIDLTMVEDGAYNRLIDWYYANEKPIPHARRHVIARAASAGERAAVDTVLGMFFHRDGDDHRHARVDEELAKARNRIDAAKTNGAKGGRKPKKQANGNPVGSAPDNPAVTQQGTQHESSPQPQPEEASSESSFPPAVAAGEGESAEPASPNAYGLMARRLMQRGIPRVSSGHIGFRALVDAQTTFEEFDAYVDQALKASDPFRYLVKTVANERQRAAEEAKNAPRGPMSLQDATAQDAADWRETKGGVNGKAAALGMQPWDEIEPWPAFKRRVEQRAAQQQPEAA